MADPKTRDQPGKRDLGSIGHPGEHRFSEECPAEPHPVKSAGKLALSVLAFGPAFDRMGVARSMEAECRALDVGVDPRFLAHRAGMDDFLESLVAGDDETVAANGSKQRSRGPELVKRKDRTRARLDPEDVVGVTAVGHRKNPAGIAAKQQAGVERRHHATMIRGFRAPCPAVGRNARPCRSRRTAGSHKRGSRPSPR